MTPEEFLEVFHREPHRPFLLEGEVNLIEARLVELVEDQKKIVNEKREVAEQSGDNWHDGVFRATDNAATALGNQANSLMVARAGHVVAQPKENFQQVVIGSTVEVKHGRDRYVLFIVGQATLYPHADEVDICSVNSPIAQALVGHVVGDSVEVQVAGRQQVLEIVEVKQTVPGILKALLKSGN